MPSIWPETFSFVTHELISTGVPVISFDLGAQGSAVRAYRLGHVVPLSSAKQLLDQILEFRMKLDGIFYDDQRNHAQLLSTLTV